MAISSLDNFKQSLVDDYLKGDRDPEVGLALLNSLLDDGNYNLTKSIIESGLSLTKEIIDKCVSSFDLVLYKLLWPENLKFSGNLMRDVCGSGNLELAKWLQENGCPWGKFTYILAAENGHLEILKWLMNNGVKPCIGDQRPCMYAAKNGHFETLKWLRANKSPW